VDRIEQDLHNLGKVEVPSSTVGELVIEHLKELDRIAYIRFASVYREFTDIDSFRRELDALTHSQGKVPATQLPLIPGDIDFKQKTKRTKHANVASTAHKLSCATDEKVEV
jgi:hypothetical protein